jgi:diaminohydroxyphosphoribosylaminopyrimidine deaminase/5-amino-6-(5-phosphoribosylamino)uracil reductase
MVGAVLVSADGEVLGEGFHERYGEPHAEANALRDAGGAADLEAATLYVNLEPCAHHGKTPPCTELILEKGIGRVVVGMTDPHVEAGGGLDKLRAAGVATKTGVLERACRRLNEAFACHATTGRPLVTLKQAQTLDGRVATRTGDARWISGEASRDRVHRWRAETDAVLVGSGTARADDPRLTVRRTEGPQPVRLVLDRTGGALPPDLRLFSDDHVAHTAAVVGDERSAPPYAETLREAGGEIVRVPERDGHLDLAALLDRLGERGAAGSRSLQSLMVEAGPGLATAFLHQDLADRVFLFLAPKLLGEGTPAVGDLGLRAMAEARSFAEARWEPVGDDMLFRGYRRG